MRTVYLLLKVKYVLAAVCEGCQEADPVLQILLNKKEEALFTYSNATEVTVSHLNPQPSAVALLMLQEPNTKVKVPIYISFVKYNGGNGPVSDFFAYKYLYLFTKGRPRCIALKRFFPYILRKELQGVQAFRVRSLLVRKC